MKGREEKKVTGKERNEEERQKNLRRLEENTEDKLGSMRLDCTKLRIDSCVYIR